MKLKITLASIVLLGISTVFGQSQNYSRLKLMVNNEQFKDLLELGVTLDHGIRKNGSFFLADFSEHDIQIINNYGCSYEILIDNVVDFYKNRLADPNAKQSYVPKNTNCSGTTGGGGDFNPATPSNFNLGSMGGYLKYDEMLAELDDMAQQYPNLITVKAPISTYLTFNNRPIYHVKISDNPNANESGEPNILYSAIHHAREPMSMSETIFYMWYLLENYGSDEEVTYLVDHTQMFFVPCINPDGYIYNETTNPNGGGMWRKNRRNNGGGVYGVDLNRNYSYGWGTTGTSNNPSNDTYCGTAAFSEPETQAMRWLVQNYDFEMAFNAHTYGEDILFPIGTTNNEFADHHDYFQAYCNHMVEYNGYNAMKSSGLYPASGDSDDYMYKVDVGVGEKDTIFVHTPEIGTDFWPASADIVPTCKDMLFPNLVLAHMSKNYNVVKDLDASTIENLNGNFNHSIIRYGRESGPVTVSIEPLMNVTSVGNPLTYNLNVLEQQNGAISYTLNPTIQFGDEIKYILKTDNGFWIKKDTIVKTFGAITVQSVEDASSTANWTGTWGTTTSTFVSPNSCYFEGNGGDYQSNANKTYKYNNQIDLTNVSSAMISYYAKWEIEADYDFVQFQVSTDGGNNWIGQCGNYTVDGSNANGSVQPNGEPVYEGTQTDWVLEEINLSDYIGQVIEVRFQLRSDGWVNQDGFYFDDFTIMYNEVVVSNPPTASFSVTQLETCLGSTYNFANTSSNNPTSYTWDFGDGNTSNETNPSHLFTTSGVFQVTLTASNSMGSDTFMQTLTVHPSPTVTLTSNDADNVVCIEDGLVSLTVDPVDAQLSTFPMEALNGNDFDPSFVGTGVSTIYANYTNEFGCEGSDQIDLTIENCSSIDLLELDNIFIYPNPNNGLFNIQGLSPNFEIVIESISGQKQHFDFDKNKSTVQLTNAANGIYFVRIKFGNSTVKVIKFVLNK